MMTPQTLPEIGTRVELEITVGSDGYVRDALVKGLSDQPRVEADAVRAAANSLFDPGVLNRQSVAVRMPLSLTIP
jgi:outer membrane biosynthesis protein TonB